MTQTGNFLEVWVESRDRRPATWLADRSELEFSTYDPALGRRRMNSVRIADALETFEPYWASLCCAHGSQLPLINDLLAPRSANPPHRMRHVRSCGGMGGRRKIRSSVLQLPPLVVFCIRSIDAQMTTETICSACACYLFPQI
jgi:hypothetical protein